jgi:hypothetical protein
MMIFKKVIPRRRFLRGVGASLALPLLDGMVPAFASTLKTPGNPVSRLSYVYVPNGIMMDKWTPATEGAGFELTPILKPLAAFRDRLVVVSGLQSKPAVELPGEESAPHPRVTKVPSSAGAFQRTRLLRRSLASTPNWDRLSSA